MSDLNALVNRRARFQRLKDAKLFNGWARELSRSRIVLESSTVQTVEAGDQVQVTIVGNNCSASFQAQCTATQGTLQYLPLTSPIRWLESSEDMRVRTSGQSATVRSEIGSFEVHVVDVSPKGLGFVGAFESPRGCEIVILMARPLGVAECTGTVRYCREEDAGFRVGVLLDSMSRINSARWNSIIEADVA